MLIKFFILCCFHLIYVQNFNENNLLNISYILNRQISMITDSINSNKLILEYLKQEQKIIEVFKELYFCITIKYNSRYNINIQNGTLQSGKWTQDRYSNTEIKFLDNRQIFKDFTICAKEKDYHKYGPVGRLEIKLSKKLEIFYLYVWWDIAMLENQAYGFDYDYTRTDKPEIRKVDKNWIQVLEHIKQ